MRRLCDGLFSMVLALRQVLQDRMCVAMWGQGCCTRTCHHEYQAMMANYDRSLLNANDMILLPVQ